jgi:uncharacterized protein YbjT (DUF2867 family)
MKITILGSTGFVGRVLIKKAIASGYQVKTLARNPEKLEEIKDKIEIITGSVLTPQIAGHNLKNKLGLIKFGNYDNNKKEIYS